MTLDEFFFQPVSCGQVRKVVESFPSNKAPGRDKVSMTVIKAALVATIAHVCGPVYDVSCLYHVL